MFRKGRLLPLLGVVLLVGLLAGSLTVAQGNTTQRHSRHKHQTDQRNGDNQCGDRGYSAWDEEWLMMSIQGDLFEIQGGKLAKQKATTQIVRDLDKIRQLAEDDLPVLKQHLELARAALKATGGQG
jgi:hypothetical protein